MNLSTQTSKDLIMPLTNTSTFKYTLSTDIVIPAGTEVVKHFELRLAEMLNLDIEKLEFKNSVGVWVKKSPTDTWLSSVSYRIAEKDNSIDWSHITSTYNIIRCVNGTPYLINTNDTSIAIRADIFHSFVRGNTDNTIYRPNLEK